MDNLIVQAALGGPLSQPTKSQPAEAPPDSAPLPQPQTGSTSNCACGWHHPEAEAHRGNSPAQVREPPRLPSVEKNEPSPLSPPSLDESELSAPFNMSTHHSAACSKLLTPLKRDFRWREHLVPPATEKSPLLASLGASVASQSVRFEVPHGNMEASASVMTTRQTFIEARKQASMRFLRQKHVALSVEDLAAVCRIASLSQPMTSEQLQVSLETKNYNLSWIFDKSRPRQWLNLGNLRTDHIVNGGKRNDHVTLINSPRSALVFIRNGTHPMAVQREHPADVARQLSIEGFPRNRIQERLDFLETNAANELRSLQHEYRLLCRVFPRAQMETFYDLVNPAAPNGLSHLPQLVFDEHEGIYRVQVGYDDALQNAMEAIKQRMAQDRERVEKTLATEVQSRMRKVELHNAEQERSLQASLRLAVRTAKMLDEKTQEGELRTLTAELKNARRQQLVELREEQRSVAVQAREERATQLEKQQKKTHAMRMVRRKERREERNAEREERLRQSMAAAQQREMERIEQYQQKQEHCQSVAEEISQQQAQRRVEREAITEAIKSRRREILQRSEDIIKQREVAAQTKQDRVQQRLNQFAQEKKDTVELHRMLDLKNQIRREEVFNEAVAREETRIEQQELQTAQQLKKHAKFLATRAEQQNKDREYEKELKMMKADQVQRTEKKLEFEKVLMAHKTFVKIDRTAQVAQGRSDLASRARAERQMLSMYRSAKLRGAAEAMSQRERAVYFETFRKAAAATMPARSHTSLK